MQRDGLQVPRFFPQKCSIKEFIKASLKFKKINKDYTSRWICAVDYLAGGSFIDPSPDKTNRAIACLSKKKEGKAVVINGFPDMTRLIVYEEDLLKFTNVIDNPRVLDDYYVPFILDTTFVFEVDVSDLCMTPGNMQDYPCLKYFEDSIKTADIEGSLSNFLIEVLKELKSNITIGVDEIESNNKRQKLN